MESNRSMRRHPCACLLLLLTASACAPRRPVVVPPAAPTPAERLASAEALVRAGCLDCLLAAYGEYDLLRAFPFSTDAATAGAVRTAALIARRERELGLADEGYGERRACCWRAPSIRRTGCRRWWTLSRCCLPPAPA